MSSNPLKILKQKKQEAIHTNLPRWTATTRINVGMSTCEIAAGSKLVWNVLHEEIKKRKLKDVYIGKKGCVGRCHLEPTVEVLEFGKIPFKYENVDAKKARQIVIDHLVKKNVPSPKEEPGFERSSKDLLTDKSHYIFGDIDYFKKQRRMALRNCGVIDPESIDDYLAVRGYESLAKVLTNYTPEQVIEEIMKSGLRGRGGGGFPTGTKWKFVADQKSDEKYIICNADEGDPGAFMDRGIIEGDPFSVIEAMTIGGYAVGATMGIVYIRAEYPLAVERLHMALKHAKDLNLLGKNILGTHYSFDIEVVLGAGAFVCGEETALIHSIEGARGMPRTRPPYPSVSGLCGKPTLINNVETWANIPVVLLDGWQYFASIGTEKSKGTKVFALAGKVKNTGLVEVPMGTPIGEVIYDIGGGIKQDNKFKALQTGGPSGGCLPVQYLNTPIDYDSLMTAGSIMGSGGMIVMDEKDCMVDVAKFFLEFTQEESCGKCTPCREGTRRMLEILNRITSGRGQEGDIEKLQKLGTVIQKTALCGLGQTAPNPVLSTIRYFRNEYEAHIRERRCPAAVCGEMFVSPCQHTCPVNIDIPKYVGYIREGKFADSFQTIFERNPLPSICGRVCHHPCESNCRRGKIDEPVSIMMLKRFATDYAAKTNLKVINKSKDTYPEKVAVVGSGPTGLACAYHLATRGYPVTIFESEKVAGGMMTLGIPEYRLPRDVVKKDIQRIQDTGVKIKTGITVGKDISINQLKKQGYKAIYLGISSWKEVPLKIQGNELDGVIGSLSFLKQVNINSNGKKKMSLAGKKVAVIGGGNAAMDAARTALRLGALEVNVVYRRTKEDMPAIVDEIIDAEKEGVKFHFFLNPLSIKGKNGKVTHLQCLKMKAGEFDLSGRRKSIPDNETVSFAVDLVIAAIGAQPDSSKLKKAVGLNVNEGGSIEINPRTYLTNIPGVFAGGDVVRSAGTVVEAMADGEQGAISIDRYLRGQDLLKDRFIIKGDRKEVAYIDPAAEVKETHRPTHISIAIPKRKNNFNEVEQGYVRAAAMFEANRCFRCDRKESKQ
ncbi:MAG: FAD-dependent oxidoreductase [bacterium]